jgi:hypothetical protein
MLTKIEETPAYRKTITICGREPFVRWYNSQVTIQLHCGQSVHQLALLAPADLPELKAGDQLEIKIVRIRTIDTWLGRLWNKLWSK